LSDQDKIRKLTFDFWRDALLETCAKEPERLCPFCGETWQDTAEYVDIGVGYQQVTANYCENPECGAQQAGMYEYDPKDFDFAGGWVRAKPKFKYPKPKTYLNLAGHQWWCVRVGKAMPKGEDCLCQTAEEKIKAAEAGYEL
jgi:hypothetical protein